MEIIFIGTGSGKTELKRNHSSIFIKSKSENLLIDTGDGISKSLLQSNIDFMEINNILITHLHADHFTGIASLITQMKLLGRKIPLKIFIHKNLIEVFQNFLSSVYLFLKAMNFNLETVSFDSNEETKIGETLSFTAKQNSHVTNKYNVILPEENFISLSLLLDIIGKKILYTSDVGNSQDLFLFENEKIDLMISETTHVNFEEIYAAFKKLDPQKLLLTHIDSTIEMSLKNAIGALEKAEISRIMMCYDGLKLVI